MSDERHELRATDDLSDRLRRATDGKLDLPRPADVDAGLANAIGDVSGGRLAEGGGAGGEGGGGAGGGGGEDGGGGHRGGGPGGPKDGGDGDGGGDSGGGDGGGGEGGGDGGGEDGGGGHRGGGPGEPPDDDDDDERSIRARGLDVTRVHEADLRANVANDAMEQVAREQHLR